MKKLASTYLLALFAIFHFSCQKEVKETLNQGNIIDSTNQLLYKVVSTYLPENLDAYITDYEYSNANQITFITTTQKIKQLNGTITVSSGTTQFFRDISGRVIRTGTLPDTSSLNLLVEYENALSKKVVNIKTVQNSGTIFTTLDSITYVYNTDNRIIRSNYYDKAILPSGQLVVYILYQYDSKGNLLKKEVSHLNSNNGFDVNISYSFEYDNKINPLYHPELSWVYWDYGSPWLFLSPNNIIKQTNNYPGQTISEEMLNRYVYDSLNRPVSEERIGDPANITKYFYH